MHLKVIIEAEVASVLVFAGPRGSLFFLGCAVHHTSLLVLADALLEEVGLASREMFSMKSKGLDEL